MIIPLDCTATLFDWLNTENNSTVVTVMTGLLFTSERSHYFRKSYLEERGLTSTKSYADRLTKIRLKIP